VLPKRNGPSNGARLVPSCSRPEHESAGISTVTSAGHQLRVRQPALQPLGNTPLGEGGSHGKVGSFTRFRAFVPPARVSTELVVQIAPSAFDPGASQFLSRRSVLKEQSKIARHFNAGKVWKNRVPQGRLKRNAVFGRPCGTGWRYHQTPAFKRRLFSECPCGTQLFGCPKIEMRPFGPRLST